MVLNDLKPKLVSSNYFRSKNSPLGVLVFSRYDGIRAYKHCFKTEEKERDRWKGGPRRPWHSTSMAITSASQDAIPPSPSSWKGVKRDFRLFQENHQGAERRESVAWLLLDDRVTGRKAQLQHSLSSISASSGYTTSTNWGLTWLANEGLRIEHLHTILHCSF